MTDGVSVIKTKTQSKNYVNAFASAVAALSRAGEDLTSRVLEMLVSDFDASRAELWLWDSSSGSCYLTHAEGLEATHRLDYAAAGAGAVVRSRTTRPPSKILSSPPSAVTIWSFPARPA